MNVNRAFATASVWLLGWLAPTSAGALAPCDETCHLAQGTPVLLTDTREVWVRRCVEVEQKTDCVARRATVKGEQREERSAPTLFDRDFHDAALRRHKLVKLGFRGAWPDLAQAHLLGRSGAPLTTTMRLDGNDLVLASTGTKDVRRPLGCAPTAVSVFTADATGFGVVVAVAKCVTPLGHDEIVNVFPVGDDRVE